MTLVENLQREDLNPIEQAHAFQRLIDEFHLTQEQVAERTGKDRATIANAVRLLKLEEPIQELLEEGRITAGHARALSGGRRFAIAPEHRSPSRTRRHDGAPGRKTRDAKRETACRRANICSGR